MIEAFGWLQGPDPELLLNVLVKIKATGYGDLSKIRFIDRADVNERIFEA